MKGLLLFKKSGLLKNMYVHPVIRHNKFQKDYLIIQILFYFFTWHNREFNTLFHRCHLFLVDLNFLDDCFSSNILSHD